MNLPEFDTSSNLDELTSPEFSELSKEELMRIVGGDGEDPPPDEGSGSGSGGAGGN